MYDEKEYKEFAFEWLDDAKQSRPTHGYDYEDADLADIIWKAYEQGYQDRIDDFDRDEDDTEEATWRESR